MCPMCWISEQIRPGTVIVDDSGPHCFNADEAVQRFKAHEDILFTAGGVLRLPEPFQRTLYLPQRVQEQMPAGSSRDHIQI